MSAGTRIPSSEVVPVVKRFVALIRPYCDQLVVAGSLRRGLPTVGDVEICVVPRIETSESVAVDMFGEVRSQIVTDSLHQFLDRALVDGIVSKRPRSDGATFWGPRAKYLTFDGIPFDLFSAVNDWREKGAIPTAEPDRFGIMLVIRTGPAEYSHRLVTPKDQQCEVGKKGNGQPIMKYGWLPTHLRVGGKDALPHQKGWVRYRTSGELIPTPTEKSVYELLGLDYVAPKDRH